MDAAVQILKRIIQTGVPAAPDAERRIATLIARQN